MPAAEAVYAIAVGYVLIVLLERDSSQNRVGLVYIKLYCSAAFIGRAGVGHTTVPNTRKVCDHKEKEEDRNDSTYVALTDPTHTGLIKRPNYIAGQRLHTRKSLKQSDHRPIWILLYFHIENVGSPPFNYTVVLNRGIEKLLKYILPAYLLLYFLTAFFWRSYLVWKATGVNPFVLGRGDSAHDYIGKVFKVLFALVVVTVIVYATSGRAYEYLMPIVWLRDVGFKLAGTLLLALSLVWTVVAQAQMGESWRIGIDSQSETALVRRGVFRVSRNPIFLGMIVTLAGLFLVLPTAVTLLILILGFVLIQIQVRLEEEHLTSMHGENYLKYRREVRRWL